MYNAFGQPAADYIDKDIDKDFQALKECDDHFIDTIKQSIEAEDLAASFEEDFRDYYTLYDHLNVVEADVLNHQEVHKYHDAIVKKLEALRALDESAQLAVRERLIKEVKSNVLNTFKSSKQAKQDALNQAIAVIAGAGGTLGKDVVGEVFKSTIVNYKVAYAKQDPKADAILVKLQKDIDDISAAPKIEAVGGNVYEL
jgi:hypothetical protein